MPTKKKLRPKLPAVALTVILPVATRLNRIEDLLIEMRGVLDFQLKRIAALQALVDVLIEKDRVRRPGARPSHAPRAPSDQERVHVSRIRS